MSEVQDGWAIPKKQSALNNPEKAEPDRLALRGAPENRGGLGKFERDRYGLGRQIIPADVCFWRPNSKKVGNKRTAFRHVEGERIGRQTGRVDDQPGAGV